MKRRQAGPIQAKDIQNRDTFRSLLSDAELYSSFKSIRGTPQYFHDMMLDVLAKVRQYGAPTFWLTFSADDFGWTDIIKITARQYGQDLDDETINKMEWKEKVAIFKRNPVTVARQIDYRFSKLWGDVILGGLHPIGQILNYDDKREYQHRGTQHLHASIHCKDAPKLDESPDEKVTAFINKYITCSIPDPETRRELYNLVNCPKAHP